MLAHVVHCNHPCTLRRIAESALPVQIQSKEGINSKIQKSKMKVLIPNWKPVMWLIARTIEDVVALPLLFHCHAPIQRAHVTAALLFPYR
jgi:hypothetical protein